MFLASERRTLATRIGVLVALAVGISALVLGPTASSEWPTLGVRIVWCTIIALLLAIVCIWTDDFSRRIAGPTWWGVLIIFLAGVSGLAWVSHYAKFALASGSFLLLLSPAGLILLTKRGERVGPAPSVLVVAIGEVVLLGTYMQMLETDRAPAVSFLLVGFVPCLAGLGDWGPVTSSTRRRAITRLAIAICAVIAAVLAGVMATNGGDEDETPIEWRTD